MKKIATIIADDSVVYRTQIKNALSEIPWIEVTATASNGKLALERISQANTDLLILDLEMPVMNGLETLDRLAAMHASCKVLVFASASKRGAETAMEALKRGASDFVSKPNAESATDSPISPSKRIRDLLEPKIAGLFALSQSESLHQIPLHSPTHFTPIIWSLFQPQIVVIGASTGGPTVLEKIFSQLKAPLQCPILIAQHMPPIFTTALAERLQRISGITTHEAKHGMPIEKNSIYLAPGNFHMTIGGRQESPHIQLDQGPHIHSVRPAVDPLFASASKIFKDKCLGVVLTGMGVDGRSGAESIKNNNGAVLIQSEETCVVFGMPGAIQSIGAYDQALSPDEIIKALNDKVGSAIEQKKWVGA